ncbi:MAG: sodium:solute symporter [Crocinitomix sp.]|nr:sodium:solute symporter [Crocinitomix sp.]
MSWIDWLVLSVTLFVIVVYGAWKTRKNKDLEGYLRGDNSENWFTIGLSIMATQASAITFLSGPGQAYDNGMGFIQIYFGLPLAMIIISVFFLPIYYRLKVYTAYQYLEQRFDVRMRAITAFLFLLSRGLAAGITIFAPSIILSTLLGWNLQLTCVAIGGLVIVYTVSGGSRAVSLTQKWQMGVIMIGMFVAFYYVLDSIPAGLSFSESVDMAGKLGKMEVVDTSFDLSNRYTIWTGILGGVFLSLSYFGTDQSQVQRYLGGKSLKESRMGLMFNGILKIPMQFFILFTGVMVFISFQFNKPPIIFNDTNALVEIRKDSSLVVIENQYNAVYAEKEKALIDYSNTNSVNFEDIKTLQTNQDSLRDAYKKQLNKLDNTYEAQDHDYIFLTFILDFLPKGLIGLLLAMIFSAAMSSTSSELNALASTTTIDFYKKFSPYSSDKNDLLLSKIFTISWGILAIIVALTAGLFDNLIELVNILGSLFYGTILGVFLLAFFFKRVGAQAAFIATIISQTTIFIIHALNVSKIIDISYLLYTFIGVFLVLFFGIILNLIFTNKQNQQ